MDWTFALALTGAIAGVVSLIAHKFHWNRLAEVADAVESKTEGK